KYPVCFFRGIGSYRCFDWNLRSQCHKLFAVFSCEVSDGLNRTFFPQNMIREGGNITHMNACTNYGPSLFECSKRQFSLVFFYDHRFHSMMSVWVTNKRNLVLVRNELSS